MNKFLNLIKDNCLQLFQVIFAFLLPINGLIIAVGVGIVIDTITGIWKAKKIKEIITSHKLSAVVSKMVLYQLSIISFFIIDKYLLGEFVQLFINIPLFITKLLAAFLLTIELISVNENLNVITGKNYFKLFKLYLLRVKEIKTDIENIKKDEK